MAISVVRIADDVADMASDCVSVEHDFMRNTVTFRFEDGSHRTLTQELLWDMSGLGMHRLVEMLSSERAKAPQLVLDNGTASDDEIRDYRMRKQYQHTQYSMGFEISPDMYSDDVYADTTTNITFANSTSSTTTADPTMAFSFTNATTGST